jgi:hypothetical protein
MNPLPPNGRTAHSTMLVLFLGGMGSIEASPCKPGQGGVSSHITIKPNQASTTVEENTTL